MSILYNLLLMGASSSLPLSTEYQSGFNWLETLISMIGAIVATIIGILVYSQTGKHNKKRLYAEFITSRRVEWIENLRETITQYLKTVETLRPYFQKFTQQQEDNNSLNAIFCDLNYYHNKVLFLLNFNEPIARVIVNNLRAIRTLSNKLVDQTETAEEHKKHIDFLEQCVNNIVAITRIYLKLEWERVKKETKQKKYSDEEYKEEMLSLCETQKEQVDSWERVLSNLPECQSDDLLSVFSSDQLYAYLSKKKMTVQPGDNKP